MIKPGTAALIIIDMQKGFIDPQSTLCVEGAAATIPACAQALNGHERWACPSFTQCARMHRTAQTLRLPVTKVGTRWQAPFTHMHKLHHNGRTF